MLKVALLHFGFAEYTIGLANALADHVELTLIHPEKLSPVCQQLADPRIQIRSFPKPARSRYPGNWRSMRAMMRIIREVDPDVLHVQETFDYWYDLTLLFNRMPPLVTTIHDIAPHPGDRGNTPGVEYTKRIAFYRSQQLIVHAQVLKDTLARDFRIPAARINAIPHGELGSLYRQIAGKAHSVVREPHTLLFFGRIWPYKGLKYLIEAIPLVAKQFPDVKLLIAGRGENLDSYFPAGYNRQHYEILNDYIPNEAVAGIFERSAIAVLPYIESSQSGVAALAYGTGTPIVASDVGGVGEMVKHERDGLLVPPGDVPALAAAIIRLFGDRQLQAKLRTAALERASQDLSWSKIAAQTAAVYARAIEVA
ncbi:glycosyltransferase family 4 protein [Chamaesiphon sp. VAR_69_metabat_338]|uniref:glycosyltransferase family 4 protein n=1 Tax=Chamaesiphon sp. VAR_69_metabat_338 TaxID=2964704 RepID=UPI00286DA8F5|nr:glycosyltransferase family 4 protein [Chamaesiphon sp. VAR_69_metabat_338]